VDVPASFDYEAERRTARSRHVILAVVLLALAIIVTARFAG
jgi:hypothetical protein